MASTLYNLGKFESQDQVNAVAELYTRLFNDANADHDLEDGEDVNLFLSALDEVGVERADTPDSIAGLLTKGAAKSITSIPRLGGALIETTGGALGMPGVKSFGQGAREFYESVDQDYLSRSPESQMLGAAKRQSGAWLPTADEFIEGTGQAAGEIAQIFTPAGVAKGAAKLGVKTAAKAVTSATKKAAVGLGAFKGGASTVEEVSRAAEQKDGGATQGDYASALLAGIPSAIVNGAADAYILKALPQFENVPPRIRDGMLREIGGLLAQGGRGALMEGGTEGLQSLVDSAIKSAVGKISGSDTVPDGVVGAFKQALFEAAVGGFVGGGLATGANLGNVEEAPSPLPPIVQLSRADMLAVIEDKRRKMKTSKIPSVRAALLNQIRQLEASLPLEIPSGRLENGPVGYDTGENVQLGWRTRKVPESDDMRESQPLAPYVEVPFTPQLSLGNLYGLGAEMEPEFISELSERMPSQAKPAEMPEEFQTKPRRPEEGTPVEDIQQRVYERQLEQAYAGNPVYMDRDIKPPKRAAISEVVKQINEHPNMDVLHQYKNELLNTVGLIAKGVKQYGPGFLETEQGRALTSRRDTLLSEGDALYAKTEKEVIAKQANTILTALTGSNLASSGSVKGSVVEFTAPSGRDVSVEINPAVTVHSVGGKNVVVVNKKKMGARKFNRLVKQAESDFNMRGTIPKDEAVKKALSERLGVQLQAGEESIHGMEEGMSGRTMEFDDENGNRVRIAVDSLVTLVDPKEDTLDHELYHAWERVILTDRQIGLVSHVFGDAESRANAYAKWAEGRGKYHPLFLKMQDAARNMWQILTGQTSLRKAEGVFKQVYRKDGSGIKEYSEQSKIQYQRKNENTLTDPIHSVYAGMVKEEPALWDRLKTWWAESSKQAKREHIDAFYWAKEWEDQIYGGDLEKDLVSRIKAWWNQTGRSAKGEEWRERNLAKSAYAALTLNPMETAADSVATQQRIGKILTALSSEKREILSWYMQESSGLDRIDEGKGPIGPDGKPIDRESTLRGLREIETKFPDVVQAHKALIEEGNKALHKLVECGLINEGLYAALLKTNPHYAPFWAVPDMAGSLQAENMEAVREVFAPIMRAHGGSQNIRNVLPSFLRNIDRYIKISHDFQAQNKVIEAFQGEMPGREVKPLIEQLTSKDAAKRKYLQKFKIHVDEVIKALDFMGVTKPVETTEQQDIEDASPQKQFLHLILAAGQMKSNPEDMTFVRPVTKDGVTRMEVFRCGNRQMFNLMTDFDINNSSAIRLLRKMQPFFEPLARMQRALVTITPEFSAANPIRDAFTSALFGKTKLPPHFMGLWTVTKDPAVREAFYAQGLGQNTQIEAAKEHSFKEVERKLRVEKHGLFAETITHPIEALDAVVARAVKLSRLEDLANFSENVGRMGTFKRFYKQEKAAGATESEARTYAAWKTISIPQNFSRLGTITRELNKISAFYGAGIGGWVRMMDFAKTNPKALTVFAALMASASVGLMAMNRRDPRWKDIPQFEKNLYWFVLYPGMPAIRIPKPFEAGTFFGSFPERVGEMVLEDYPEEGEKILNSIFSFNTPMPVPTAIEPIWQNLVNRDWKGSPIVTTSEENLAPSDQFSPYTSETAKMMAAAIRAASPEWIEEKLEKARLTSPKGVDNLLKSYGAGASRYVMDVALDPAIRKMKGEPYLKPGPELTMADMPIARRFISRFPSTSAQPIRDFYDIYDKASRAHATMNNLKKARNPKRTMKFAAENRKSLMAYKRLNDAYGAMSRLSRANMTLQASSALSRAEKRKRIDANTKRMASIAKAAVLGYSKIQ